MIIRTQHNRSNPYAQINKAALEDDRLSFKAVGILAYLLSRPDNWETRIDQLVASHKDGKEAVRSAVAELIGAGYLRRERQTDARGKVTAWKFYVFEAPELNPQSGFPEVGFPEVGFPEVENPPLINNEFNKKEFNKTEINNPLSPPEGEPPSRSVSVSLERLQQAYNENRPQGWAEMQILTKTRRKVLERLVGDCGGAENALAALVNALKYAQRDKWYSEKRLSFDNFASNGKILQLHEKYIAARLNPDCGWNSATLVDYLRARRPDQP